ncbi:hypothetical protein FORC93_943 [Salmonella enterica subsp. enterica serovar Braenderup]|nr:hypothetical protein FORC93_943 [Salmonella enterica subsp. enterica serovar Braenderup]
MTTPFDKNVYSCFTLLRCAGSSFRTYYNLRIIIIIYQKVELFLACECHGS